MRITKEVLYLRRDFTKDEKLEMGLKLAESYNLLSDIEEEEAVMKSQIKERKAQVEATIGTLSRNLGNGYLMENTECELVYDTPHVGEVTYKRKDSGATVKTRAMTEAENQQELEFAQAKALEDAPTAEESTANIESFFGEGTTDARTEVAKDPDAVFSDPNPAASQDAIKEENDEAWGTPSGFDAPAKKGRGRPKGTTTRPRPIDPEISDDDF